MCSPRTVSTHRKLLQSETFKQTKNRSRSRGFLAYCRLRALASDTAAILVTRNIKVVPFGRQQQKRNATDSKQGTQKEHEAPKQGLVTYKLELFEIRPSPFISAGAWLNTLLPVGRLTTNGIPTAVCTDFAWPSRPQHEREAYGVVYYGRAILQAAVQASVELCAYFHHISTRKNTLRVRRRQVFLSSSTSFVERVKAFCFT